jgi:hypothetical protein
MKLLLLLVSLFSVTAGAVSYEQSFQALGDGPDQYANFAAFPASATDGELGMDQSSGTLYVWSSGSWQVVGAPGLITSIGALNGQAKSANAGAVSGNTIYMQSADATWPGVLTAADWSTFNSKEPAIAAGTALQYWRGDKTWQTLDTAAVPENTNLYFTNGRAQSAAVADAINNGTTNVAPSQNAVFDALALKIDLTEKGSNNGVATLDAGGKIPVAQLPNTVMEYQGAWNATTNTPALADGTGSAGDVYLVSVAGTQNLGSGAITFAAGDWAVYNGAIWEKTINSNAVVSVNGQQGVVSLDTDDISEGATNLYHTNARAIGSTLIGYSAGAGVVSATDSVLSAIQKLDGNVGALTASQIDNVPAGNIVATDIQAAINELDSDKADYNKITVIAPQAGTTTTYSTLQAAFNSIPAATSAATARQVYVVHVPSGTYEEDVTVNAENRRILVVAHGSVALGQLTGASWGSGGTPRTLTVTYDTTTSSYDSVRPFFGITSKNPMADGMSTHQAYGSKFRISGDLVLTKTGASSISHEVYLETEVFGNMDCSTDAGNINVYTRQSRFRGTFGCSNLRLQLADRTRFGGLVTANVYSLIKDSVFDAGMTVSSAAIDLNPSAFLNTHFTGTFTGPASSLRLDGATNGWFILNGASLAGGATKVYVEAAASATEQGEITTGAQTIAGAKTFSSTIVGSISGNAATATAFAANPTDCGAGTKATAIDASGNLTCSSVGLVTDVTGVLPIGNGGAGTQIKEVPTGLVNNSNAAFTLSQTPVSNAAVSLYKNGRILIEGTDYTIVGTTITMTTAPNFAEELYAVYRY